MRLVEDIEVKQNLRIIARERGKLVTERIGHNIFLDLGREWLAHLISLASIGPDVPERDDRVKYIALGIGGTRQLALAHANTAPYGTIYGGTNLQTDTDAGITTLERPVRISGSEQVYPGIAGDQWVGTVQAPPEHATATEVTYRRLFGPLDISYGSFASVPVSEVGLLTNAADPENYLNTLIAYDTFDTISKTGALELEVIWTLKFS
jgi:hypothetical protein